MPAYDRTKSKLHTGILRYPLDAFDRDTDYLRINTVKYKPPGSGDKPVDIEFDEYRPQTVPGGQQPRKTSTSNPRTETVTLSDSFTRKERYRNEKLTDRAYKSDFGTIFLPIPSNIQDGNSVKYTEGELDGLTSQVLDFAVKSMKGGDRITSIVDSGKLIRNFLVEGTNLLRNPDFIAHFTRSLAAQAANIPFGGNLTAAQLLARQNGQIVNPNMELLFDGVTLRSFKFSFKMTPRNEDEAKEIRKIIRHFKKSMTPSAEGTMYLNTPLVFELTYMKGGSPHPFLHRFKPCALTDCSINYTGESNYATYQDGTPVSMVMDLGFKELEPIYADDYTDPLANRYNLEGPMSDTDPIYGGVGY